MGVPVATPIDFDDLSAGFKVLLKPNGVLESFIEKVRSYTRAEHVFAVNSGRAAIYIVLMAIAKRSKHKDVIIPAFICPSVARAIVKAKLNVVLCDITPDIFGIDPNALEKLLTMKPLAVIASHLFGYPSDINIINELASKTGAIIIEDAAQAFGAQWNKQPVGTLSSVGIFSFGMSKVLSTLGGGIITVNDEMLIDDVRAFFEGLPCRDHRSQVIDLSKIALLSILSRSHHLRPFIYVWEKRFQRASELDDFDLAKYSPTQAAIAQRLVNRFEAITAVRRNNARKLERGLMGLRGITIPQVSPKSSPVYLRFPVVVDDVNVKDKLVKKLAQRGINVSQMYDKKSFASVCSLASRIERYPVTEYLCERMVNLPTHAYLTERDISTMIDVFHSELN
jgi:dTDP-4-amino-4,6-dideoxygalactose transaminase